MATLKERLAKAKVGDLVYTDGESGFCRGSWEPITAIRFRYDAKSGEKYRQIKTHNWYTCRPPFHALTPPLAYSILDYKTVKS
jgi:hypothetical protein